MFQLSFTMLSVVMIQYGYNILYWIGKGLPIQAVCGVYIFNYKDYRVSNRISIMIKVPGYVVLIKYLAVDEL